MKLKLFILLAGLFNIVLISLFFFSSCGFIGAGGGSTSFFEDSRVSDANPGDGDTPRLSSRLKSDSDLGDESCEDNNRCKEACRNIYERVSSYKECYRFNIEKVSLIEDVFYALLEADEEELEDIEEEDLETYINTGIDGWRDKVISKQIKNSEEEVAEGASDEEKRADLYTKLKDTLEWIIEQEQKVVPVLEEQDRDNEILEKIILEHCNVDSSYYCRGDSGHDLENHTPDVCSGDDAIAFDGDDNRELFVALSFVAKVLFEEAMDNRRYSAFALGQKLVEKACINRNSNSAQKCIDAFYRFVREKTIDLTVTGEINEFNRHIENIEEEIGEDIINNIDCP